MLAWRTSPVWGVWQIPVLQRTGIGMHCRWDDTGIEPKSVIRLAECVSCFRRGMLLCILFASVRILLLGLDVARYAFG